MNNRLIQPLADALLAARRPDGTWPEPLDWLAKQVMKKCVDLLWPLPHDVWCGGCNGAGWVPYNPVALHWPDEWARGTVWKLCSLLWEQLPTVAGEVEDKVWYDADFLNILVEAVKAIAEAAHAAS